MNIASGLRACVEKKRMRGIAVAVAVSMASVVPANAAWQYYACPSDNFAAQFPDTPKQETAKFSLARHKDALSARTYTANVDNVIYRMLVADYSDRALDGASILEEVIADHTSKSGRVVGDDSARIEPDFRGATYGRRVTSDLPNNGGRNLTTFYFRGGKLYEQSVTILPANGDYTNPDASLFVESLLFNLTIMNEEIGSIPPNIQGCGTAIQPFIFK